MQPPHSFGWPQTAFVLFSGGETEGEGRESELQHLRDRQRVGQTLGRDGAGNQAALPTGATNWAVTSLGNTYRYYGNALHYSCIIKIANSYCSCPHEIRPKLTHPNHSIQSNVLYQNQLQAIFWCLGLISLGLFSWHQKKRCKSSLHF